mmetsp:Transcript_7951/g.17669  ORF Transcript_7951/g.17669 Transcript_7951/m.17669 type:complete len:93 (+) Transcript_7951:147-425(+)
MYIHKELVSWQQLRAQGKCHAATGIEAGCPALDSARQALAGLPATAAPTRNLSNATSVRPSKLDAALRPLPLCSWSRSIRSQTQRAEAGANM